MLVIPELASGISTLQPRMSLQHPVRFPRRSAAMTVRGNDGGVRSTKLRGDLADESLAAF